MRGVVGALKMSKRSPEDGIVAVRSARSGPIRGAGSAVEGSASSRRCRRPRQGRWTVAAIAAAAVLPAATAEAQTVYYTHPSGGDWDTTFDFTYFGWRFDASGSFGFADLPPTGGTARISLNGTNGILNGTVLLNYAYTATNALGSLFITSGNTLNQASGTSAMFINNQLSLSPSGGGGTYQLRAGSLSAGSITVGAGGSLLQLGGSLAFGAVNQSSGTVTIGVPTAAVNLYLSDLVNSAPTYNLSGGNLAVSGNSILGLGWSGTVSATFNQSGGSHGVGQDLLIGDAPGAVGSYNLSGATSALSVGGSTYVGYFGNGSFTQSGGTHSIPGNGAQGLYLGYTSGTTGTYNLQGGSLSLPNGGAYVGNYGNGVYNQSGGAALAEDLEIGYGVSGTNIGSGTVNLSGGSLSALPAATYVGDGGIGVFNHSGGTFSTDFFYIAAGTNSIGTYNMSNGATLNTGGPVYVGFQGVGTFNQTGGTHNVGQGGPLYVGYFGTNAGTYNLSGGSLAVPASDVDVGYHGIGIFNQSGGSHTAAFLTIGAQFDGTGVYNLSADAGSSTLAVAGDEVVGLGATGGWLSYGGSFNQTGGVHTIGTVSGTNTNALYVGYNPNSTGEYNLSGGSLTTTGNEYFGFIGYGNYSQSGGTNQVKLNGPYVTRMIFGYTNGARGDGSLSGGTLAVDYEQAIGFYGNGTFDQSGGSNTTLYLTLGFWHSGSGTYTLSGGVLNATGDTTVGQSGTGSFWQSGGTHITGGLFLGYFVGSSGHYSMSNGTLTVLTAGSIGGSGTGIFDQSGGTTTIDNLHLGDAGGNGSINLSGGTLSAASVFSRGTINQTGGVANFGPVTGSASGTLLIGNTAGASALMNVASFDQNVVRIQSTGTMVISHNATRATNSTAILAIAGNGLLDLGNNALLVNNGVTPEAAVRQYLHNAYNAGGNGIGDWNGKGGITSADAIAAHNGQNPSFKISVGYVNGVYASDPLINGPIPGQETLPTSKILVRPALYGDFNLDGKVDDTDLAIFSGLGQYNKPNPKFGWLGGDLNYDGKVDDTDLLIFSGAGNYNGPSYGAAVTPKLSAGGREAVAATTTDATIGDGKLDFIWDPLTGDLKISYDGDPHITAASPLQVIRLSSASGLFRAANFNSNGFSNVTANGTTLNGTILGGGSVPDGYDLGQILPVGVAGEAFLVDLTLQWNVLGGGLTLKQGDMFIPEPVSLAPMGMIAGGLLSRRRKRKAARCCGLGVSLIRSIGAAKPGPDSDTSTSAMG